MNELHNAIANSNESSNEWIVSAENSTNNETLSSGDFNKPDNQEAPIPEKNNKDDSSENNNDLVEALSSKQDNEKNKLFAKLRIAEKKALEAEKKLQELESKMWEWINLDESKFEELYQKKLEKEEKLRQERLSFVKKKEEDLLKSYDKSDVNRIFKLALDYTSGDIDKAVSLFQDVSGNKWSSWKPPVNFGRQNWTAQVKLPETMAEFKKWNPNF